MRAVQRPLLIAAGSACVVLGAIGAVVPGLPTTVFLIAASFLFARSSPRLRERVLASRWGTPVRRFEETRSMSMRAKVIALVSMWAGIATCVWAAGESLPILVAAVICLGLIGTGTILFVVRTQPVA